jgi:Zn-dependent protease
MLANPLTFLLLLRILFLIPAILLGLVLHELAHAAVAVSLGDPTPKNHGRLSLNPLRHLDPLGVILVLLVGIGYGHPVQIDPVRLRGEFSRLLVALAGPAANLAIAVLASVALKAIASSHAVLGVPDFIAFCGFAGGPVVVLETALFYIYTLNLFLVIFNLLPIPPLDGFELTRTVMRRTAPKLLLQIEMKRRQILFGFLVIFFVLPALVPVFGFLSFFRLMIFILHPLLVLLGVPLQVPCG